MGTPKGPGQAADPLRPGDESQPVDWHRLGLGSRVVFGTLPPVPAPAVGEYHLWPVPIVPPDTDESGWLALLLPDERARTDKYLSDQARRIFVTSRVAQRAIAACYLGRPPTEVAIDRTCLRCGPADHGRPRIRDGGSLDVSVTHTDDWVLVAVVGAGAVGVDLEATERTVHDLDRLADSVLSHSERVTFTGLAGSDRIAWFYRCWTRKEAATKLTGHGLTVPFESLRVDGERAEVTPLPAGWPAEPIFLADAPAPPGFAIALASTTPLIRRRFLSVALP